MPTDWNYKQGYTMECEPIVIKPHLCSQSVSPTAQHINQIQHMTAGAQRAPAATATAMTHTFMNSCAPYGHNDYDTCSNNC